MLNCLFGLAHQLPLAMTHLCPPSTPPPHAETVPIRPFKHNEYERFIVQVRLLPECRQAAWADSAGVGWRPVTCSHTPWCHAVRQGIFACHHPELAAPSHGAHPPPLHLPAPPPQAYPYYASIASMMAGFLAVGAFFLWTK